MLFGSMCFLHHYITLEGRYIDSSPQIPAPIQIVSPTGDSYITLNKIETLVFYKTIEEMRWRKHSHSQILMHVLNHFHGNQHLAQGPLL